MTSRGHLPNQEFSCCRMSGHSFLHLRSFHILTWLLTAANLMAVVVAAVLLYFPSPPGLCAPFWP